MNARFVRRRSPRKGQQGLTLVEVLVTSAVLGVGMVALAHTYNRAQSGVRQSRLGTAAIRIAEQRLERLATLPVARLAGCAGPATGCRSNRTTFAPVLGNVGTYRCTQNVDGMGFHDPTALSTGLFRVDTSVSAHPDPRQQTGALVITVSVCWSPAPQQVEQIQLQRMVVPEV